MNRKVYQGKESVEEKYSDGNEITFRETTPGLKETI